MAVNVEQMRHDELIAEIKSLKNVLNKPEPKLHDNGTKESIDRLYDLLSNLPKPQAPIVNIENKNEDIINHLQNLMDKSKPNDIPAKEPIKEWYFRVVRNNNGFIDSIIAKAK